MTSLSTTSPTTATSTNNNSLWKKFGLNVILLVALYMLHGSSSSSKDGKQQQQNFSVWVALSRHEPSARIFRSLFEVNLILLGTALCLAVWSKAIGVHMVRFLLFQPVVAVGTTTTTTSHGAVVVDYHHDDDDDSDHHRVNGAAVESYSDQMQEEEEEDDDMVESSIPGGSDSSSHGIHSRHQAVTSSAEDGRQQQQLVDENTGGDTTMGRVSRRQSRDGHPEVVDEPELGAVATVPREEEDDHVDDDDEVHPALPVMPTAQSALSAFFDTLMVILVMLFFFTWSSSGWRKHATTATNDDSGSSSSSSSSASPPPVVARIASPMFALVLFFYLAAVLLWKRRRLFWSVLWLTLSAPLHAVTFRDGFIGDILTSSVRPLQDISFTVVYLCFGLRGWWSEHYYNDEQQEDGSVQGNATATTSSSSSSFSQSFVHQADAQVPAMEKSWILHTVLLPLCMMSPLWWRFLQNLRQTHDERRRWPFLGNALKYFCAAQVAVFGVFYPEWKQGWVWLSSFVLATLYQIWWDVFMDWNLLERQPRKTGGSSSSSSLSFWYSCRCWRLRSERLYRHAAVYWGICLVNFVLRFCWTLSFVPPRYLSATGVLTENFSGNVSSVLNPTIASAEIIRRTLWGLLRFENEAIRVGTSLIGTTTTRSTLQQQQQQQPQMDGAGPGGSSGAAVAGEEHGEVELVPMKMEASESRAEVYDMETRIVSTSTDMASMSEVHILVELCTYATVFAALGLIAAAHRGTL